MCGKEEGGLDRRRVPGPVPARFTQVWAEKGERSTEDAEAREVPRFPAPSQHTWTGVGLHDRLQGGSRWPVCRLLLAGLDFIYFLLSPPRP